MRRGGVEGTRVAGRAAAAGVGRASVGWWPGWASSVVLGPGQLTVGGSVVLIALGIAIFASIG